MINIVGFLELEVFRECPKSLKVVSMLQIRKEEPKEVR